MNARKAALIVLLALFLAALACNMPIRQQTYGLSAQELRNTLEALRQLQTPLSDQEGAPDPPDQPETPFPNLATATPELMVQPPVATPTASSRDGMVTYFAQSGDTLPALSARFSVEPVEISSPDPIPPEGLIPADQILFIPDRVKNAPYSSAILPDSEIIFSPSTLGFSVEEYVNLANGFLSTYEERLPNETLTGWQIIDRVATLTSTNPRLLLALLEFRSGWVLGQPEDPGNLSQPIGFNIVDQDGLYRELSIAANQINAGYYRWRVGSNPELEFPDKSNIRVSPSLNAGSVSIQRIFSFFYSPNEWTDALYGPDGFTSLYTKMFGDPWERAAVVEPIFPNNLVQPVLELPFLPGERWSLTGGPHYSWNAGSPRGGLDFAPVKGAPGCQVSSAWVTAPAPGLVVRTGNGYVVLDLDKDGYEQTGWVLFFLHIAEKNRVPLGTLVNLDERLGHPSCEGGFSTGTHVHLARKFNGEWISADHPLPFLLSGWQAFAGEKNYAGGLEKNGEIVIANSNGTRSSSIVR
jgi:murein DD-endopeptidase MepM/ murein hydrolase activator NlpD